MSAGGSGMNGVGGEGEVVKTVFLSSTGADLHAYREAMAAAIQKLDGWKCVRMEACGPRLGCGAGRGRIRSESGWRRALWKEK
jgi:hypothetical protein